MCVGEEHSGAIIERGNRGGARVWIPSSGASPGHVDARGGVAWPFPYCECRSDSGVVRSSGALGLRVKVALPGEAEGRTVSMARER